MDTKDIVKIETLKGEVAHAEQQWKKRVQAVEAAQKLADLAKQSWQEKYNELQKVLIEAEARRES